jgi:hypothetical protein
MGTKIQSLLLCQTTIALVILLGCVSHPPTVQQQTTVTPSQTVAPAPTIPTVSPTAPPPLWATFLSSPEPPAMPDQELRMAKLLQSKDCVLPCYLNIMPGKTSLSEARIILKNIGAGPEEYLARKDGAAYHTYRIIVGDPLYVIETPESTDDLAIISQYIELITVGDTVEGIEVSIETHEKTIIKFRQYWLRYSTREIFLQLGPPDHLYITKAPPPVYAPNIRHFVISYEKKNVLIEYYGHKQETNICTEEEDRFIDLNLSLYNPNSGLDIYYSGRIPPTNREVYVPIEEVLGVNTSDFYNQVLLDPLTCFKLQTTKP